MSVASYDAVIKLVVEGESALKRVQERIDKLYKTIDDLERKKKYAGSQAAAEFVRQQADELERVVTTSKTIIKQDERRIVQQSKLNSAVDLYERRLKQTVNSGAAGLKKFQAQISQIESAFKFFKDRGNTRAIQALATELGRMVEYSNSVSRNERARAANQAKVFKYVKEINAYEEQGLDVARARQKLAEFTEVASSNQLNQAKKYSEAVERQLRLLKEQAVAQKLLNTETAQLQQGLNRLEEEQRKLENSKLDEKARQIQLALDKQAAAAAETAAQIDKLNQRQSEFIARTDEAAQAASRQTAEFYRQQRIAKEVAKINAAAPPPQLMLPPAAPGAPAMSGGARRPITGPVERLGGARTQDQADVALRFAEALKEQVRPLSQINSLYAGIYGESIKLASVKALPSTEMLNAAARGLQTIEAIEGRRFSTAERRAKKLQDIQEYYAGRPGSMANAGFGVQGPGVPPGGTRARRPATGLQAPGVMDAILGAGFPVLFGGGPGSIIGGAAGGLAGGAMGGMAGMALSIALSAVGQQIDQIVKKFADVGEAIRRLDVDSIRESFIFVNQELDTTVRKLVEAGQYEQARAVLAAETARQTGVSAQQIQNATQAVNRLQGRWAEVVSAVGGLVALIATPLLNSVSAVLRIVSLIATGASKVISFVRNIVDSTISWVVKLFNAEKLYRNIKDFIPFITEEQEKVRAAADASIESGVSDLRLKKQLLDVERARLEGSNRIAQQSQLDAEFTKTTLTVEKELRDEIKRINREGTDLTDQQRALQIALAEGVAKQKLDEALITKEKAEQKLLNDALIASLRDQADAQQAQATQYAKAQSSAAQIVQIELQRLQQRMQFVTSLNQEASLIDQTASKRKELAEIEYQTAVAAANSAVQQAAAEYDIVQAKYEQNNADIEQVNAAQRKLQTAVQARGIDIEIAGLKREQALETAEIERRQQQLNAYTKEYERINAGVLRSIEEQTNALSNRATLLGAISQATQTINGIEIEALSRELERTSSVSRRAEIIDRIYQLEVQNARVVLEATRAQIQADIARANMAYKQVELEYQKYRAVVLQAEAQGIVNSAHYEALKAQESALRMAKDNLDTSHKVANVQLKAANAVFKAAVDAAELKRQMSSTAEAAGQFAGNVERAAGAMRGISKLGATQAGAPFAAMGGAEAIQDPGLKAQAQKIWQEAERFAATKGIASIQADILQRARDAIAQIAFRDYLLSSKGKGGILDPSTSVTAATKAAVNAPSTNIPATSPTPIPTTQPIASGLSRQPGGGRGTAVVDTFPVAPNRPATINLQTGPVLQQEDGKKYVTLNDLEKILQDFAAVVFNNARSVGGRQYQGVS